MKAVARVRPLLVRPLARYRCEGDGLCCADAHWLGPVSPREVRALATIDDNALIRQSGLRVLRTTDEGRCVFLDRENACAIHHSPAKPQTCKRYPFLLTATPDGGRIGTDHRCPCRTIGERAQLSIAEAEAALGTGGETSRLSVDLRVSGRVPIADGRTVSWRSWRTFEDAIFDRLLVKRERVESVLDASAFPALREGSWTEFAEYLANDERIFRWARARQWFGDAILAISGCPMPGDRPRPWKDVFDRAEARTPVGADPEDMLADWVADVIWSLEWIGRGDFAVARADFTSRVAIARCIASHLEHAVSARPDRAMAEAIAIIEMVGVSDVWSECLDQFVVTNTTVF